MPKLFLACLSFLFFNGVLYSQSVDFNPIAKDSLASDSISYSISGYIELNDSLELQMDLVQIYPDSLIEKSFEHIKNQSFRNKTVKSGKNQPWLMKTKIGGLAP